MGNLYTEIILGIGMQAHCTALSKMLPNPKAAEVPPHNASGGLTGNSEWQWQNVPLNLINLPQAPATCYT